MDISGDDDVLPRTGSDEPVPSVPPVWKNVTFMGVILS